MLRLKGGHRPAAAEPNLVIVLRKGKVLREGLPSLRYDQYYLGTVSDEGRVDEQVDGANVYHVAGLDPKASEAGGCAKRHKVHDTAVRAAVQAAAQAGLRKSPAAVSPRRRSSGWLRRRRWRWQGQGQGQEQPRRGWRRRRL